MSKKMNIFLELEMNKKSVEKEIEKLKDIDSVELKFLNKKLKALREIETYVNSYEWCKSSAMMERVIELREVGFDYSLIKAMGYTPDSLKSFMYRCTKSVKEKIGEDTISMIMDSTDFSNDNINAALIGFRILTKKFDLNNLLLSEVLNYVPDGKNLERVYKISDCIDEINFLYGFSKIAMEFNFSDLDVDKLNTIIYILTHQTERYKSFQSVAFQLLLGKNYDIDTVREMINNGDFD